MTQIPKATGWWHTIPGMLTAVAGIITAVTGLLVALNQTGFFKDQAQAEAQSDNHKIVSSPDIDTTQSSVPLSGESLAAQAADANAGAKTPIGETIEHRNIVTTDSKTVTDLPPGTFGVNNPFPMKIGETYKMTLDENEDRYFRLSTPINEATIILDMQLASGKSSNLQSILSILDQDGGVLQRAINFNEIDVGHRKTGTVSLKKARVVGFKLLNTSNTAIFWLTVVKAPHSGLVPFFGGIVPKPLALQETGTGTLSEDEYAYYASSLPKGQYKIILDFENSARRHTNIQGYLALLDPDGGNQDKIIKLNEVDVSYRKIGKLSLKNNQLLILQIYNSSHEVSYAVKITDN